MSVLCLYRLRVVRMQTGTQEEHQQAHLQESDLRQHGALPEHAAQRQGAYQGVNDQKETAAIQQNPYRAVLAWFLAKFPKYDEYKEFFADNGEAVEPAAGDDDNFKAVSNF